MTRGLFRAIVIISALASVSGCVAGSVEPLPPPPPVSVSPTSSSLPDYSGVALSPVEGSTTVPPVAVRPGGAVITGLVRIDGAPAAGATVHLERYVGTRSAALDITTGADGRYRADNVLGGRYTVRSFRPPDGTMDAAQTLFVGGNEVRNLDLNLRRYTGGGGLTVNVAPNPPLLGQTANVAVLITTEQVDASGVARSVGVPNVPLILSTDGGRVLVSSPVTATDGSGRAIWQFRCDSLASQGLTLTRADGTTQRIDVATCQLPPSTTVPETTAPSGPPVSAAVSTTSTTSAAPPGRRN